MGRAPGGSRAGPGGMNVAWAAGGGVRLAPCMVGFSGPAPTPLSPPTSASILRRGRRDRDETANLAIWNRDEPGGEHVSVAMKSGRPAGPFAYLEGRLRPYGSR